MGLLHIHRYILPILLFLLPVKLFAQPVAGNENLYEKAVKLYQDGNYEEAGNIFEEVLGFFCSNRHLSEKCIDTNIHLSDIARWNRSFEAANRHLGEAQRVLRERLKSPHPLEMEINLQRVFLYSDMTDFEEAQQVVDTLFELAENPLMNGLPAARAYLASGYLEDARGNLHKSLESYSGAITSLKDLEQDREVLRFLAVVYNNMGILTRRMGDIREAMNYFQEALEVTKSLYGDNHPEVGLLYNSIGTIHYNVGDYGQAADYFLRTADIYRASYGEYHERVAAGYNNAGVVYLQMDEVEKATENLEKAQRIKERLLGNNHIDTAIGYSNLASVYLENKNYDDALKNYQRSISVRKEIYGSNHPNLISPYISLGDFYIEIGEYELARDQLFEAERIVKLRLGDNYPDIWTVNIKAGQTYLKEEKYDKAISYFQLVLYLMTEGQFITKDSYTSESFSHPFQLLAPISGMGDAALETYKKEGGLSALEDAFYFFTWAADIVEDLQINYQSEVSKLNLINQNYSIFTHAIEVCYYQFQETSDEKWLDEIYRLSEMSHSRIAVELLQELEAKNFAGVPENILNQERTINTNIAGYYQQLHAEQEKGFEAREEVIAAYRDSIFSSRQHLRDLTRQLEQDYPAYYQLKYDQSFADRATVSTLLADDETLVKYIVADEQFYALVLDKQNISFHPLGSPDSLSAEIMLLREAVSTDDIAAYSDVAHQLYQQLLDPVLPSVETKSMIIVPDQMLHYLPFELLLTEQALQENYYRMPFLIRDYQISYIPSATVLQVLAEQRISNPRNLFAVAPFNEETLQMGDQTDVTRYVSGFSPLPLTRFETREIAEIFEKRRSFRDLLAPERTEILLGRDATRKKIETVSFEEYGFIHFATHAFVNEEDPSLSGIAFWGDENETGVIFVNDIYNMKLNADLVVLGACETGLGTVYKGEGMIGFTRAFIYAGASNLLVSMWRVNDQPTANLMIQFYEYAKDGYSYSESLQMAKLDLINQPQFAAPRHWAAFILQGR